MRSVQRASLFAAILFAATTSGCSWISGLWERPAKSAEINHPGADVTFGIDRDKPKADEAKPADAAEASPQGEPKMPGAPGTATAGEPASAAPPEMKPEGAMAQKETPSPAEMPAAEPAPAPAAPLKTMSLQGDAVFQFGKSDESGILPAGKQKLDELAAQLKQLDPATLGGIEVIGHADRLGSPAGNRHMSERRAATIANYLVGKGIDSSMIKSIGKGDTEPLVQCKGKRATPEVIACLGPNRRVEVIVHGK